MTTTRLERLRHEAHVVADGDDRPAGRGESLDDALDPRHAAGVLSGRRLVEDDDRRVHRQDRCERQQLPTRVAEVVRVASASVAEADGLERGRRRPLGGSLPLTDPRFRGPNSTSARTRPAKIWRSGFWNTMPDRGRERRDAVAGDVDAVVEDAALGRAEQAVRDGGPASTCRCRSGRRSPRARRGRSPGRPATSARVPSG